MTIKSIEIHFFDLDMDSKDKEATPILARGLLNNWLEINKCTE
jgi:hypothetical protein